MTRKEAASLGGQKMAPKIRETALNKYYLNPNMCKECGQIIHVRSTERPSQTKKRTFCNSSCAAKFNIRQRKYIPREGECARCGNKIIFKKGSIYKRKYCETCVSIVRSEKSSANYPDAKVRKKELPGMTKSDLLQAAGNPYKFKLYVTQHAKETYTRCYPEHNSCLICGFEHMQIAHIKDVSDFGNEALVKDINDPKNLIGLCPNHHWALDHGKLSVGEAKVVEAYGCNP